MTTFRTTGPSGAPASRPARQSTDRAEFIDSPRGLARLRRSLWLPQPTRFGTRIVLHEHTLGASAKQVEARVNELHASCGCRAGRRAVLGTMVTLVVLWVFGDTALDGRVLLIALSALIAAAVTGKLAGILWSRALLFLLLRQLERRLTHPQAG